MRGSRMFPAKWLKEIWREPFPLTPVNTPETRRKFPRAFELIAILVNAVLVVAFYAAEMNLRDGGFLKNNLSVLSERGFYFGLVVLVVAVLAGWKTKAFVYRCFLLLGITLFNQACLMVPMQALMRKEPLHEPCLVWSSAFRRLERFGPAEAGTPCCQRFHGPNACES